MRFRDAMAPRLSRRAWTVLALLLLLPLAALWPRDPAQAEPDDGALEISRAGEIVTLEARSVPLDRLLDAMAETMGFAVVTKCGAVGCPAIRGRLRGALDEVLGSLLQGHGYSRTYGPASATDQRPTLRRLVVLTASGPIQTFGTHRTAFRGPPARRVARRDAKRITSAAQRRQGIPGRASEVRPQGRISRFLGASDTLDDALGHRLRVPSFRGNGNCDPMGTKCLIWTTRPDKKGQTEAFANSGSNWDADFANLMQWGSRGSRSLAFAEPALSEGSGHLGLSNPAAPLFRQAPLSPYRITSGFGPRRDPLSGHEAWHQGVDLAAPADTKVLSTAPGTVLSAGRHGSYGIMVEVDHGAGVATRYAHLSEALVRPGQRVAGGDPLGVIGASGRTTGQHLHLEVRIGGRPVDPMQVLTSGRRLARLDREFPSNPP